MAKKIFVWNAFLFQIFLGGSCPLSPQLTPMVWSSGVVVYVQIYLGWYRIPFRWPSVGYWGWTPSSWIWNTGADFLTCPSTRGRQIRCLPWLLRKTRRCSAWTKKYTIIHCNVENKCLSSKKRYCNRGWIVIFFDGIFFFF